ncbi:hypothetical protein BMS3Abin10_01616 [bacterium BMS3Abin10]|nr:hypothetical protein BMS3Abin10_01616 [bacterium BMS3Abin10]GBE39238.1 hypothetical protein BMS3Bbin08_01860 [bacterium BMS3Bbin08]
MKVKLSDIIDAIEIQPDEGSSYLNKITGEIVTITEEEINAAYEEDLSEDRPEWLAKAIETAKKVNDDETSEIYMQLPTKFDIHEYSIMERFCLSISDKAISESLYYAIKSKGAFRRFKNAIHRYGVADDWYKYRDDYLKEIVKDWCEENEIKYTEK